MGNIKFGTDGWRALMAKDFTFENVEILAQAFSDYMNAQVSKEGSKASPKIAIGYDHRENSENFAETFTQVLIANNIQVVLSDQPVPTPAISFSIVDQKLNSGIVVTASHNPAGYNGIKIKTDFGGSAEKSITEAVEKLIGKNPVKKQEFTPENPRKENLLEKYMIFLKSYVNLERIKQAPYKILVDSMHGVGGDHIQEMLAGGKIQVETIRANRDITFGGTSPEPIPQHLGQAIEKMKSGNYDLAIATDGDADRVGAIRPGGDFVSPGTILSLILLHFAQDLKRTGSVVTTISNTALIFKVAQKCGLKVHETPVGFKHVCEIMRRENVLIGGEESGGIGFQNYLYERDGMLSGLLLLEMMAARKQTFEEILEGVEKEFGKFFYVRLDTDYPNELKPRLFETLDSNPPKTIHGQTIIETKSFDGRKFIFADGSWLLFRLSGTEPVLRIYSESTSRDLAEAFVAEGKKLAFSLAVKS